MAPHSFPRSHPVRLVSASDSTERVTALDELKVGIFDSPSPSEKENPSPRSSPRAGLPSEALEEFLSILKPSFIPPLSPRRRQTASLPNFAQEQYPLRVNGVGRLEFMNENEENDLLRTTSPSRITESNDCLDATVEDVTPFRWYTSPVLSSPISRTLTMNPFARQHTYPLSHSPTPPSPLLLKSSISPSAVPLPLPTPDELMEL